VAAPQDYADAKVPDGATVNGLQIALIISGIGATLPMFTLGTQIASAQGLRMTVLIALLSCGMVGLLAVFTSVVGARCRVSTYQILERSFGSRGAQLVNMMLAIMLLGWFATTADMLGGAVQHAIAVGPKWPYTVGVLALMTLTGIFGFHVMEKFVRVTVPLLTVLMLYVVWLSLAHRGLAPALARAGDHSLTTVDALSSVIGAIVLTAVLAPDLTRYARTDRSALVSVLGIVVGFPAALLLAAIPAAVYGEHDLMDVMTLLGIPGLAIVVLVISTWTSNTSNLYSATLTLATLFKGHSTRRLGLWGAVVALIAAAGGISDYFIPLLIGLGVISAPLAGVYVVDFFVARHRPGAALVAWLAGSVVGLVETYSGHSLTGIPAVDSILLTAVGQFVMIRIPASTTLVEVQGVDVSFTIAVNAAAAPISGAYFLADVDGGVLDGSAIFRIVKGKIDVVQMGLRETDPSIPPVIKHETTGTTGLRHLRGTVSLARFAPGAVYHSMFVCMRDEPSLDEGGKRNPDGQGFAAFGHVVDGMDRLQRIFDAYTLTEEYLQTPLRLESVRRVRP
jgi:cytosine permease